jgi:hypothetical protein
MVTFFKFAGFLAFFLSRYAGGNAEAGSEQKEYPYVVSHHEEIGEIGAPRGKKVVCAGFFNKK